MMSRLGRFAGWMFLLTLLGQGITNGQEPPPPPEAQPGSFLEPSQQPRKRLIDDPNLDQDLLNDALRVIDPAERAWTLNLTARELLLSNFDLAEKAVREGGTAALQIPPGTLRDVRLSALVNTCLDLTERILVQASSRAVATFDAGEPLPQAKTRVELLEQAASIWRHAASLARSMRNPNYQSESLWRIASEAAKAAGSILSKFGAASSASESPDTIDPARARDWAARALEAAERTANECPLVVWRDFTLATICYKAGAAGLFQQGLAIARRIQNPGYRATAMVYLADAMADRDQPELVQAYQTAAEAVATIKERDPRIAYASIVIDSMISSGRFEDARRASVLMPDDRSKQKALAAVARSMGRRGLHNEAFAWIDAEVAPENKAFLRRSVNEGLLINVEEQRKDQLNQLNRLPSLR
jgi:hypothetical protein